MMLIFIAFYNVLSVGYLVLVVALGYVVWRKRGWLLSLGVSIMWLLVSLIFFGACWERYGLVPAFAAIFTHGWLEFAAVFYWVYALRRICLSCRVNFENDWISWRDLAKSIWKPRVMFHLIGRDVKRMLRRGLDVLVDFWSQKFWRELLLVMFLIVVSAFIETYVTPVLVSLLV